MTAEPVAWPNFDSEMRAAVDKVLSSGRVNYWNGTEGREFEKEFAEATGVEYAIFVANGTVALELALRALALPLGSEVITTPFTFIATSSAIVAAGLKPVFADVDSDSGNITPATVLAKVTENTSAVLVVHLGGWPADMHAFRTLCDSRGLALVEDCAQAHGAMIGNQHVGTFGDAAAWSFCTDKIISTGGEGGMVATRDRDLRDFMWSYKDHGKSWAAVYERDHPPGFRWLHESFGTNWRATEMQAALGRIQYRRLPDWHRQRTENAELLRGLTQDIPALRVPQPTSGFEHAYYRIYAYLDSDVFNAGWDRDRIIGEVNETSPVPIATGSSAEIYLEKAFDEAHLRPRERLMTANRMRRESLAMLVHPGLTSNALKGVSTALRAVTKRAVST